MKTASLLVILVCLIFICSCRKESFITGAQAVISTSDDSLHFDTLFTRTGSVTHFFKIYNENNGRLKIAKVFLGGGSNSFFRINADGISGPEVQDLEIAANDSLYVFVTVKIDATASNLPFVVEDSIGILYNGNERWVRLQAWGQNANFMRSKVISSDTTWSNKKPFVILGSILINQGAVLTIQKGTKIYLHADAPFLVDGTLKAIGEKYDSTRIRFQGDRLDEFYRDHPGSWPGIYFRETSTDNILKQVIVKNAYQGIIAEKPSSVSSPKVILEECIIDNCYDAGILGVQSSISAVNCLVSNCGKNIQLLEGGNYEFIHCTDVAISDFYISHRQPVLAVTNFIKRNDIISVSDLDARFTNCIFWGENGTVEDEVVVAKEGNTLFEVDFKNCLWKVKTTPADITSSGIIANEDPLFENIDSRNRKYNFMLKEGSPAIDAGINTVVTIDLEGNSRMNIPDAGAYETTF